MTDVNQIREDLSYVRQAMLRRRGVDPRFTHIYLVWAVYVLIGYTLNDFAPGWANWYFIPALAVGLVISHFMGKRTAMAIGDADREMGRRQHLHWYGGIILVIASSYGLETVIPDLRGFHGAQVGLVLIGMCYFFHGVHFDSHFLWLGPLLMVGGITVGFIPVYPWTCLGIVFAVGLSIPYLHARLTGAKAD
jgi:hypothetical protein